jgi:hypothetical protein
MSTTTNNIPSADHAILDAITGEVTQGLTAAGCRSGETSVSSPSVRSWAVAAGIVLYRRRYTGAVAAAGVQPAHREMVSVQHFATTTPRALVGAGWAA